MTDMVEKVWITAFIISCLVHAVFSAVSLPLTRHKRSATTIDTSAQLNNLQGHPGDGYCITINVGTPPQKISVLGPAVKKFRFRWSSLVNLFLMISVLVDTGSSNLAIATVSDPFISRYFITDASSTYTNTGTAVDVPYTEGEWFGEVATDLISVPPLPNVRAQFAGITKANNFYVNDSQWQGILGLAYPSIARPDASVIPLFDAYVKSGAIPPVFSMQLCGTVNRRNKDDKEMGGTMIWGGTDKSLYKASIHYTPIVKEGYYQITVADVEVGGKSLGLDCKEYNYDKTIVDSGTTNLRLPKKVFNKLADILRNTIQLPDGVSMSAFLNGENNVCWREGHLHYQTFPNISLVLAKSHDTVFRLILSPQQYLRHLDLEDDTLTKLSGDCFTFSIATSDQGTIIGAVVMEAFYTIFDQKQKRVGFALSTCRGRDPTKFFAAVEGPFAYTAGNASACVYLINDPDRSTLAIVGYVMAGVCVVCVLPVVILLIQWQYRTTCKRRSQARTDDTDLLDTS